MSIRPRGGLLKPEIGPGRSFPLGATAYPGGVNFLVYSKNVTGTAWDPESGPGLNLMINAVIGTSDYLKMAISDYFFPPHHLHISIRYLCHLPLGIQVVRVISRRVT